MVSSAPASCTEAPGPAGSSQSAGSCPTNSGWRPGSLRELSCGKGMDATGTKNVGVCQRMIGLLKLESIRPVLDYATGSKSRPELTHAWCAACVALPPMPRCACCSSEGCWIARLLATAGAAGGSA